MIFKGYEDINTKETLIAGVMRCYKRNDGASLHATVRYDRSDFEDHPEVVLYISRSQDGIKAGEHTVWIEFPLHDCDGKDDVWIYEKNFKYADVEDAIETFFKKVEQTEAMFDTELEVWP